ncbi:MAG: lysophospholipid acyltransferase family protein [Deltaproteobacteria bacterium]|nr:lysophospholipid acyltransferase family protein [Deltaproteobacteria bacterium]
MNIKNYFYFTAYIPFFIITKIFNVLPLPAARLLGRFIGCSFFCVSHKYRTMAVNNILKALSLKKIDALKMAHSTFENFGVSFVEMVKFQGISREKVSKYVEIEGYHNYLKAAQSEKGAFLMSAHIGNWEMLAAVHSMLSGSISVIYKKTKNPFVEKYISKMRNKNNIVSIYRRNSARKIVSALKKGDTVGILPDLRTNKGLRIEADFFGMPALTNYGIALLAIRTGAPIVPGFAVRTKEGRLKCIYGEPIYLEKTGNDPSSLKKAVSRINLVLEDIIKKYPDQWYWMHDRWKPAAVQEKDHDSSLRKKAA